MLYKNWNFKLANDHCNCLLYTSMLEYLSELAKREYKEELTKKLHTIIENLSPYLENDHIILLGGYKGLLHSMEIKDPSAVTNSGVFIDPEKDLPYGLAEIELK